jgi:hypothetical protein
MSSKIRFLIIFCLPVLALALYAAGQSATSPVVIHVADATGAAITNAKIRIDPAPAPASPTAVDSKGSLTLAMKPGEYALFVASPGFTKMVTHFDVRETKQVQTIPIVLETGHGGGPVVTSTAGKDSLAVIAYPYHHPAEVSATEIKAMPRVSVTIHNPHTNADEIYSGVRLADLLTRMGAPLGSELRGEALANYIVATGSDGYQAVLAIGEVDPSFHPGEVLVADTMNGEPLDAHSGPLKLVVTEDKRPARSVRNLTTIELRSAQ